MTDYIEREAAIKAFHDKYGALCTQDALFAILMTLEEVPAADVRPVVHGKWTWIVRRYYEQDGSYTLGETIPVCSQCGKRPPLDVASSFCPYCGVDMREVDHD